ncbi:sugar transferase [Candidatus Bipolaricaulota bacterium]
MTSWSKRSVDLVASVIGLTLLSIPFLLIWLLIRLDSKGPGFFRQERIGRGGKPFIVWKFRTMIAGAIEQGLGVTVAADDARITRVGHTLRRWGLDELPQLINVLSGEMSLVGPRPTLGYQVENYDDTQRQRLEAKPGITSLAVVSGRNTLTWRERIDLDVWYVEHASFWLDLRILLRTLYSVLVTKEGLYGEDGVNDPFVVPPDTSHE